MGDGAKIWETEPKYGRRSQNIGDGAKIWETRSNMWESGFEPKLRGKGTKIKEKRGQNILDRGQNTEDMAKQLFTVAKIWETHVKI